MENHLLIFTALERVTEYSHLSGEYGENRERNNSCQIPVKNDYEALQYWLNEYRHKPTTFRTYQKEAERFLLWSIIQLEKPLSSLKREDIEKYIKFLDDPKPRSRWCTKSGRGCKRGDKNWRPFTGKLSHSSKMTALSVIDSLLSYLVDARYLAFNPFSLIRKRNLRHDPQTNYFNVQERILNIDEWYALLDTLESRPESKEKARLVFIIKIFYFLGLRVNELASHQWNAFRKVDECWWFYVFGKGDKVGRVPVNDELLRAIITYRASINKTPFPNKDETFPLVHSFTTGKAITPRQINKLLKELAVECAKKFEDQPEKAHKIRKFSAHWLRHLSASMQDQAGIQFKHIRANHRHENDETTRLYVHALDNERFKDMQKLKLRPIIK